MVDRPVTAAELARLIDHTLLAPTATAADIDALCREASERGMFSVCVNPCWVARAKRNLEASEVAVCTVIGFPLGADATVGKAAQARWALDEGADELDMVMNLGFFLGGQREEVEHDIHEVSLAARGKVVKVILETALLSRAQIVEASALAVAAGASFVKTSTGFGPGGASVEAVAAMRETVGPGVGVKASGGIRDAATAAAMIEAGASRLGASKSLAILDGWT